MRENVGSQEGKAVRGRLQMDFARMQDEVQTTRQEVTDYRHYPEQHIPVGVQKQEVVHVTAIIANAEIALHELV